MPDDRTARIAELACDIWEKEAWPNSKDFNQWLEAESGLAAEPPRKMASVSAKVPKTRGRKK